MLLSPLAAKVDQKSSILVGATGTLERILSSNANATTKSTVEKFEGENYISGGIEGYYTYKVHGNVQVAGGLRALYVPEHKLEGSTQADLSSGFVLEPRLTAGYEFAFAQKLAVTPYAGFGLEVQFDKQKTNGTEEWEANTKLVVPVGVRVGYSNFYANLNLRFDVTSTDLPKGAFTDAPSARNWGFDGSIGAEF